MNPNPSPPPPPAGDAAVARVVLDGTAYDVAETVGEDGQRVTWKRPAQGAIQEIGERTYVTAKDGSLRRLEQKLSKKEKRALRRARRR